MNITYTILAYTKDECVSLFNKYSPHIKNFQVDIQDGKYIKNKTITIEEFASAIPQFVNSLINQCTFDFHLQVLDYKHNISIINSLINNIRIGTVLIHYSLKPDILHLKSIFPHLSFSLVLNPDDDIAELSKIYNLQSIPSIQIMGYLPGPQSRPLMPSTLNKIEQLRTLNYRNKIMLDGGITDKTLPFIMGKKYRPDILCVGGFFTKAGNHFQEKLNLLSNMIKEEID